MGTEYILVDYESGEMLDLGKGSWWKLNHESEILLYHESIIEFLKEHDYFQDEKYGIYVTDVIWNFIKNKNPDNLYIHMDVDDSLYLLKLLKFKYIGTRYIDDFQNINSLNEMNKHLDPNSDWYKLYNRSMVLEEIEKYISTSNLKMDKLKKFGHVR